MVWYMAVLYGGWPYNYKLGLLTLSAVHKLLNEQKQKGESK
jgi:hypothetical protein